MAHAILDVAIGASAEQIKRQYRKLSLLWHPDRPGGNSEKFQEITRAYERLLANPVVQPLPVARGSDSEKRFVDITLDQAFTGCAVPVSVAEETVYLDIPEGVDTGEVLALRDMRVGIRVQVPPHLKRSGLDISYRHAISLRDALCGTVFEFDYVNGQRLRIVNQTSVISPTYRKTLPRMGMKRGQNQGSLTIEFEIMFPKSLSPAQLAAISSALE